MLTINSISGGSSSAYMAVHYPADYDIFCLVCTDQPDITPKDPGLRREVQNRVPGFVASRELDHTLKLVLDLEQLIQRPIVWATAKQGQNERGSDSPYPQRSGVGKDSAAMERSEIANHSFGES